MATTYLQLVNDVLVRLRESTVTTVTANDYSALIGKLVNDAKREVEDAWNWEGLRETISFNTAAGTVSYVLTGADTRFRISEALNDTSDWFLSEQPASFMTENIMLNPAPNQGAPEYFAVNGVDSNGDISVDVYPVPDGVYTIRFNGFAPTDELTSDSSTIAIPKSPVVLLAWAKAIEERGEDGGINVSSQYSVAKQSLGDHIAIEANRRPEELIWYPK